MRWWQYLVFKDGPSELGAGIAAFNVVVGVIIAIGLAAVNAAVVVFPIIYAIVWGAVCAGQIKGLQSKKPTAGNRECPYCGATIYETVLDGGKQSFCNKCGKYLNG